MITARANSGLCEVGGILYATGGFDADDSLLASVECYNTALDTWSAAPALPRARSGHFAFTVGGTMYVLSGVEATDEEGSEELTTSVLTFHSSTQAWSELAPMPEALHNCGACVLGSSIFVFGGYRGGDAESVKKSTYCYDTATNLWSTLAPMPETRMNHSVCVVSGLIYVIGGEMVVGTPVGSVHCLDPATNAWSMIAPMLNTRTGLVSYVLGGTIYAAGGFGGASLLSSVERYDVASDRWEVVSDMALSAARADFGARVMTLEVNLFDNLETKAPRARS
jgi:N-acetylneuraminic acid mutarotase